MTSVRTVEKFDVCEYRAFTVTQDFFRTRGFPVGTICGAEEHLYGRNEPAAPRGYLRIQKYPRPKKGMSIPVSEIPVTPLEHLREFFFYQGRAQDTTNTVKAVVLGRDGTPVILSAYLSYQDEDMGGWYYDWTIRVEPVGEDRNVVLLKDTKIVSPCPN